MVKMSERRTGFLTRFVAGGKQRIMAGTKRGFREELYKVTCSRFPFLWRLMRIVLWGRVDLNKSALWQQLYKSSADVGNLETRVHGVVDSILTRLDISKNLSVLDIGAGYGNFICRVPDSVAKFATETNLQCIETLEKHGIVAHSATLPILPFASESFDVVVCISVFEHLANRRVVKESIREIHRVVRRRFFLSVPHESMQPWKTIMHNLSFKKDDILRLCRSLFKLEEFIIDDDGRNKRAVYVLQKIPVGKR
jgi:SAM-dependent methyltransferase